MPYTNAWNESTPAGSAARTTVDDLFRQLKVDIRERMDGIVVDWTADPVVLGGISYAKTGKTLIFSPHGLMYQNDEDDVTVTDAYVQLDNESAKPMWMSVPLPIGITITKAEFLVDRMSATSVTATLAYNTFDLTPTLNIVSTLTATTGGLQKLDSGTLSHVTAADRVYFAKIEQVANNVRFYGLKITYNSPTLESLL